MAASDSVGKTKRIAVYGATGFTGRLIARELKGLDADFVVAGRDRGKLEGFSEELGGVPVAAVGLDDPEGLRTMLDGCSVVIGATGPFCLHAEPLVAAAAETGTHYLDTTGEQPFIRMVFEKYGRRAAETGAALVSGMGFDYAPGDMIAALTAEGMGPLDELTVAYHVEDFAPTHGTGLSALEMMAGGDVVFADGEWRPAPRSGKGGRWRFGGSIGEQPMLRYPAGEQITVPRHVETRSVRTLLNGMVVPPRLMPLAVAATPLLGAAMRSPLRAVAAAGVRRMPAAPSEKARKKSTFTVECEARAGFRTRRGAVHGSDVYGLTAVCLTNGALICADSTYDHKGALAPAQAFDPSSFLDALDLEVTIEALSPPR